MRQINNTGIKAQAPCNFDWCVWTIHAYQSLACETAIDTDFSELFSLKRIYIKYKQMLFCRL